MPIKNVRGSDSFGAVHALCYSPGASWMLGDGSPVATSPYAPSRSGGTRLISEIVSVSADRTAVEPKSWPITPAGGTITPPPGTEPPTTEPPGTGDTPSTWATTGVDAAIAAGLVPLSLQSGYTNQITHAEYCALAVMLYEEYTGAEITGRSVFIDTNDVNVEKMAAVGVVEGVGENRFDPDGLS